MTTSVTGERALGVLVVDDDATLLNLMSLVAQELFPDVDQASDGHEALRCLSRRQYAVVLSDLSMPGPRGLKVLRQAKQNNPGTALIAVTGFIEADEERQLAELGAVLVHKPFGAIELQEVLQNAALGTGLSNEAAVG